MESYSLGWQFKGIDGDVEKYRPKRIKQLLWRECIENAKSGNGYICQKK